MDLPLARTPPLPASGAPAASALTPALREHFDGLVRSHDIVLFMKGLPDAPRCGFSARAAGVLQELGHPFEAVDVFAQEDPGTFVRALAQWAEFPTLPQVWVKGELIGGSDIALEMAQSGEMQRMLQG